MSMTKRYLESLPQAEQDDILGLPRDEWDESAENEPTQEQINEWMRQRVEAEDLFWARELAREGADDQC